MAGVPQPLKVNQNGTFDIFTLKEKAEIHPGRDDQRRGRVVWRCSDYEIYVYSLVDGSLAKIIDRPFEPRPIQPADGEFHIRKMAVGGLGQGDGLRNYPPIFHLNYTEKGNLLVWTSNRDASGRQVVDVYDEHLKKAGTDLKFINPGRSNLIFLNQKVYVPDYGFGSAAGAYASSPLEIPAAPFALKVFDALL